MIVETKTLVPGNIARLETWKSGDLVFVLSTQKRAQDRISILYYGLNHGQVRQYLFYNDSRWVIIA